MKRSKHKEEILWQRKRMMKLRDDLLMESIIYERLAFHEEADFDACIKKSRGFRSAAKLVYEHADLQ